MWPAPMPSASRKLNHENVTCARKAQVTFCFEAVQDSKKGQGPENKNMPRFDTGADALTKLIRS